MKGSRTPKRRAIRKKSVKIKPTSKVKRRTATRATIPDTYDTWLAHQKGRPKIEEEGASAGKMPTDTMQEWLSKQTVKEKEETKELAPPLGTTEEWLRKQISERLSAEQAEQEAELVVTK